MENIGYLTQTTYGHGYSNIYSMAYDGEIYIYTFFFFNLNVQSIQTGTCKTFCLSFYGYKTKHLGLEYVVSWKINFLPMHAYSRDKYIDTCIIFIKEVTANMNCFLLKDGQYLPLRLETLAVT